MPVRRIHIQRLEGRARIGQVLCRRTCLAIQYPFLNLVDSALEVRCKAGRTLELRGCTSAMAGATRWALGQSRGAEGYCSAADEEPFHPARTHV